MNLGKVVEREVRLYVHAELDLRRLNNAPLAFLGRWLLELSHHAVKKYKELHGGATYNYSI